MACLAVLAHLALLATPPKRFEQCLSKMQSRVVFELARQRSTDVENGQTRPTHTLVAFIADSDNQKLSIPPRTLTLSIATTISRWSAVCEYTSLQTFFTRAAIAELVMMPRPLRGSFPNNRLNTLRACASRTPKPRTQRYSSECKDSPSMQHDDECTRLLADVAHSRPHLHGFGL